MGRHLLHLFHGLKCRIPGVQLHAIISGEFDAIQPVGTNGNKSSKATKKSPDAIFIPNSRGEC